jgi:integrase
LESNRKVCAIFRRRGRRKSSPPKSVMHTGMRLSEQYSCTWSQVQFDRRTIELTKTKNGSARAVHLNSDAVGALESLRRPKRHASDPVFPREGKKRRLDTRSWFQPCLEEAGISGYVWHCNRHTFCSWLAMAGQASRRFRKRRGTRRSLMLARYSHLSPEHRLSVIDRIASQPGQ